MERPALEQFLATGPMPAGPPTAFRADATTGVDTATFSGSGTGTIDLDTHPNLAALNFSGANYTLTGGS